MVDLRLTHDVFVNIVVRVGVAEGGGLGPAPQLVRLHRQTRRILVLKGLPVCGGGMERGEMVKGGRLAGLLKIANASYCSGHCGVGTSTHHHTRTRTHTRALADFQHIDKRDRK